MKKLIKGKGIFDCTFKVPGKCTIVNSKNKEVTEWKLNRIVYLKSNGIVIASIDIHGKLYLYPTWNENRTNLYRICKFTGISTKEIKHMIELKHYDIIIEHKLKLIN